MTSGLMRLLIIFAMLAYVGELAESYQNGLRHRPQPGVAVTVGSSATVSHADIDWDAHDVVFGSRSRWMRARFPFTEYAIEAMRRYGKPPQITIRSTAPVAQSRRSYIEVRFNGCTVARLHPPFTAPMHIAGVRCRAWDFSFWQVAIQAYRVKWRVHEVELSSDASQFEARRERAERLGSEAVMTQGMVTPASGNIAVLDARASGMPATARWELPAYEFSHLGPMSRRCSLDVYVTGSTITPSWRGGTAQLWFNGKTIATVSLPHGDVTKAPVFFTPLYAPAGIELPVRSAEACRSRQWSVQVRVDHATWAVERVGVVLHYVPANLLVARSSTFTAFLAAILTAVITIGAFCCARAALFEFGLSAMFGVIAVFAAALVTHDQWDFPVWVRFSNLLAFGNGNPALMWAGTPLWAMLAGALAPVQMAVHWFTGNPNTQATTLLLKLLIAQCACWTAVVVAQAAPERYRRMLFFIALLSPMGLYDVAAGYREPVAALVAVCGMAAAMRRGYWLGMLLLVIAGSISEALLPLILLPGALRFARSGATRSAALPSCGMIAAAGGAIVIQWLLLPRGFAETALAFRAHSYRYGEGSWLGLLTTFKVIPPWVGALWSTWITLAVFGALAALFVYKYVSAIRNPVISDDERSFRVLAAVAGLVFAFFCSYSGADISTWWALIAVATFLFYRKDPLNPYPLLLSTMAAACQYAVAGTRDFVNWAILWPEDKGIFGILSDSMHAFAVVVVLLIIAGTVAVFTDEYSSLFGKASPAFGLGFALVCMACTIRVYPLDVIFCLCAGAVAGMALYRLWSARQQAQPWQPPGMLRVLTSVLLAIITVAFSGGDLLWSAIGIAFACLAYTSDVALCDVALCVGALLLLKVQPGFGWLSFAGYALLIVAAAFVVVRIARRAPQPPLGKV